MGQLDLFYTQSHFPEECCLVGVDCCDKDLCFMYWFPPLPVAAAPTYPLPLPPSLSLSFSTEDVNTWDPMSDDFKSTAFNSYTEGPGALLPANRGEEENICLYVCNIPTTITKVCVKCGH